MFEPFVVFMLVLVMTEPRRDVFALVPFGLLVTPVRIPVLYFDFSICIMSQ